MSSGKCLLDTSVLVAMFRHDEQVRNRLESIEEVLVPVITCEELRYGSNRSQQPQAHHDQIERLLSSATVLPCDRGTADVYAGLKDHLARNGTPIPENDIWIAAIANQYAITLLTHDHHFELLQQWVSIDLIGDARHE